ncbi:MAG: alpha-1,2-fucosyltransferase [Turicibacter sanguinis]|uniref:alpha-1,2-fucosyltransferase n=1 Tax=Turicibacter sanguinis TaxID=154288 RepID=UPI002F947856
MAGRAGNQFFRYSAAAKISKELNEKMVFNFKPVFNAGFSNNLDALRIDNYIEDDGTIYKNNASLTQKILVLIYRIIYKILVKKPKYLFLFQKKFIRLFNWFDITFSDFRTIDVKFRNKHNLKILLGCFENPKLLSDDIKNYVNKYDISEPNKGFYNKILNSNSVCITIRRGDFLIFKEHNICDEKFYYNAIEIMKNELYNPVFFIFSDDIEWCKNNIIIDNYEVYYETGKDTIGEKIKLMTSCKHFIISNSTFSWWAQHLSNNQDKFVIGPQKMYTFDIDSELIEENWRKL